MQNLYKIIMLFSFIMALSSCGGGGSSAPAIEIMSPPIVDTPPVINLQPISDSIAINVAIAPSKINPPTDYSITRDFARNNTLESINALGAYQRNYLGQNVTIAFVGAGVDYDDINDLEGKVSFEYDIVSDAIFPTNEYDTFAALLASAKKDDTNDGFNQIFYVRGEVGLGGEAGNFHGVAPQSSIIPIKITDSNGIVTSSQTSINDGYNFAIENGAQIINNSRSPKPPTLIGRSDDGETWELKFERDILTGEYYNTLPFGVLGLTSSNDNSIRRFFSELSNDIASLSRNNGDKDVVYVWKAGDNGWSEKSKAYLEICIHDIGYEDIISSENCSSPKRTEAITQEDLINRDIRYINNVDIGKTIKLRNYNINRNDPGGYAHAPTYIESLRGHWLVVGAVDTTDITNITLADFSNGCGDAKQWCIMAPGVDIPNQNLAGVKAETPNTPELSGTTYSAAIASGALAVLKSRLPSQPMSVVLEILLTTATDLGEVGVDDVYGRGLINLSNAIHLQANTRVVQDNTRQADINKQYYFPESISFNKYELDKISLAVVVTNGIRYNMRLSEKFKKTAEPSVYMGDTAKYMLDKQHIQRNIMMKDTYSFMSIDEKTGNFNNIGTNIKFNTLGEIRLQHNMCDNCKSTVWDEWETTKPQNTTNSLPFFGRLDKSYILSMENNHVTPFVSYGENNSFNQYGTKLKYNNESLEFVMEVSNINEKDNLLGSTTKDFANLNTKTQQSKFITNVNIIDNMKLFAEYETATSNVSIKNSNYLKGISNMKSVGWKLGIYKHKIIYGEDELKLVIKRKTDVDSGNATFKHIDVECLDNTYKYCFENGFKETLINIAKEKNITFALGYKTTPSYNSEMSFGAEYNTNHSSALSFQWQFKFK